MAHFKHFFAISAAQAVIRFAPKLKN